MPEEDRLHRRFETGEEFSAATRCSQWQLKLTGKQTRNELKHIFKIFKL